MVISHHARMRYISRIMGEADKRAVKRIAERRKAQIDASIKKVFQYSTHIWRGKVSNNEPCDYYLRDNIILVCNPDQDKIVTLYRVYNNYETVSGRDIVRALAQRIQELKEAGAADEEIDEVALTLIRSQWPSGEIIATE